MTKVDLLAIAAHRDDVELICGGTMIKAADQGYRTGVIDLTAGEMGTKGSAELRGEEASRAASVMGLAMRQNFGLPDSGITNTPEIRARLAAEIRKLQPTIVIAPALGGRHPDHREAAQLVRDACFMAGIGKVVPEIPPHRPRKVIHAITYREDNIKPTFVVDISGVFERKMEAVKCYSSQFDAAIQAGEVFPNGESLYDIVRHQAAHYGSLIRTQYGEPFHTFETMRVDDVVKLEVSSF